MVAMADNSTFSPPRRNASYGTQIFHGEGWGLVLSFKFWSFELIEVWSAVVSCQILVKIKFRLTARSSDELVLLFACSADPFG